MQQTPPIARDVTARAERMNLGNGGEFVTGFSVDDLDLSINELAPRVSLVRIRGGAFTLDSCEQPTVAEWLLSFHRDFRWEFWDHCYDTDDSPWDSDFADLGFYDARGRDSDLFVVAVRERGGWFISPTFTIAEYAVELSGLRGGDFRDYRHGSSVDGGGDTPEDALEGLLHELSNGNIGRALDYVSNDLPALRVYADTLADAWSLLQQETSFSIDFDRVFVNETPLSNNRTKLVADNITGSVSFYDRWDGHQTEGFKLDRNCAPLTGCIPRQFTELTGIDELFFVTSRENGNHRINPLVTIAEYAILLLDTVTDDIALRATNQHHHTEPTDTIELNQATTIELNDAGFTVIDIDTEADTWVKVEIEGRRDDEGYFSVVDPAGAFLGYSHCWSCFLLDADNHRLVVDSRQWEATDITVTVHELADPIAADPFIGLTGTIGESRTISFDIGNHTPGTYQIESSRPLCVAVESGAPETNTTSYRERYWWPRSTCQDPSSSDTTIHIREDDDHLLITGEPGDFTLALTASLHDEAADRMVAYWRETLRQAELANGAVDEACVRDELRALSDADAGILADVHVGGPFWEDELRSAGQELSSAGSNVVNHAFDQCLSL